MPVRCVREAPVRSVGVDIVKAFFGEPVVLRRLRYLYECRSFLVSHEGTIAVRVGVDVK